MQAHGHQPHTSIVDVGEDERELAADALFPVVGGSSVPILTKPGEDMDLTRPA